MSGTDQYGRQQWDEKKALERLEKRLSAEKQEKAKKAEKIDDSKLAPLTPHLDVVELSKGIGRRQIIGENVPISQIGNYSCPICGLFFKDSNKYLTHLNSPEHNRRAGMSMVIEKVSDEEVISRVQDWVDYYTIGKPIQPLYRTATEKDE